MRLPNRTRCDPSVANSALQPPRVSRSDSFPSRKSGPNPRDSRMSARPTALPPHRFTSTPAPLPPVAASPEVYDLANDELPARSAAGFGPALCLERDYSGRHPVGADGRGAVARRALSGEAPRPRSDANTRAPTLGRHLHFPMAAGKPGRLALSGARFRHDRRAHYDHGHDLRGARGAGGVSDTPRRSGNHACVVLDGDLCVGLFSRAGGGDCGGGHDISWPDGANIIEGLWKFIYLNWLSACCLIPGLAFWVLGPDLEWADRAWWAFPAISWVICFPLLLFSSLAVRSMGAVGLEGALGAAPEASSPFPHVLAARRGGDRLWGAGDLDLP